MTIRQRVARLEAVRADIIRSAELAAAEAAREFRDFEPWVPAEISETDQVFLDGMVAWSIGGRTPQVSDDVLARYHRLLESIDVPATRVARQGLER